MRKRRPLHGILCLLLLGSLACPEATTDPPSFSQEDVRNFYLELSSVKGGFCIAWLLYEGVIAPDRLTVTLPPSVIVFNDPEKNYLGSFEFDAQDDGFYDYKTPIRAIQETTQLDGNFPVRDGGPMASFEFNELTRHFEIINPLGGMAIGPGRYGINLRPGVIAIGEPNGLYNIPVTAHYGEESRTIHKVLAHRTLVFPHFALGTTPGLDVDSDINVANPHGQPQGALVKVYDYQGNPASLQLGPMTGHMFSLSLPPYSSSRWRLANLGSLERYWGTLSAFSEKVPQASTVFSTRQNGAFAQGGVLPAPAGVAGISTAPLSTHHSLSVVLSSDGTGTALAVVNPSDVTAQFKWELLTSGGQVMGTAESELESMHQDSFFFEQLFPELNLTEFSGGLSLISDTDVGLISLSTHNGIQQASLESGRPGQ